MLTNRIERPREKICVRIITAADYHICSCSHCLSLVFIVVAVPGEATHSTATASSGFISASLRLESRQLLTPDTTRRCDSIVPSGCEPPAQISALNANMDLIDAKMHSRSDKFANRFLFQT